MTGALAEQLVTQQVALLETFEKLKRKHANLLADHKAAQNLADERKADLDASREREAKGCEERRALEASVEKLVQGHVLATTIGESECARPERSLEPDACRVDARAREADQRVERLQAEVEELRSRDGKLVAAERRIAQLEARLEEEHHARRIAEARRDEREAVATEARRKQMELRDKLGQSEISRARAHAECQEELGVAAKRLRTVKSQLEQCKGQLRERGGGATHHQHSQHHRDHAAATGTTGAGGRAPRQAPASGSAPYGGSRGVFDFDAVEKVGKLPVFGGRVRDRRE